ncbi:MAG: response regulator [Gammaproteobacteria bacterium]|nr:response regulator [Gammaproteobacteria bacterium]
MITKAQNKVFNTLLVEDSSAFRTVLNETLQLHFPAIHIEEAEDGEKALQKINLLIPDLVFLDIKLPGENGIELTRHIKMRFNNIVIVILSSYDIPEYRQAAFRNGADCFIAKESLTCLDDVLARVEGTIAAKTLQ